MIYHWAKVKSIRGESMLNRYIFLLLLLILSACSNPKDIRFGASPSDDMQKNEAKLKKLPPTDFALLTSYLNSAQASEIKGRPNPAVGKTVAEVLDDARSWQKAQEIAAAEERERQESAKLMAGRIEAERKLLRDRVAGLVAVTFVKRTIIPPNPSAQRNEPVVRLEYDIENKGGKAILALKGKITYKDLFGNRIVDHPLQVDKTVPIGGHVTVPVNYRVSPVWREMMALAELEDGKFSASFWPESLVLEGGETLRLSDKPAN